MTITDNVKDLNQALISLWGATAMPFSQKCDQAYEHPDHLRAKQRLEQLVCIQSSGLIMGPNGVGKSYLINQFLRQLNTKQYQSLVLTHSSLTGSGLLRSLSRALGQRALFRREDILGSIYQALEDNKQVWPILILEEAQNLSAVTLEEIRLLACFQRNTAMPFSLILVGDESLMPRLRMGVNLPLMNRLSFSIELQPFCPEGSCAYINERLRQVAIRNNPFSENAQRMLIQGAGGIARLINNLAQRAFEAAAFSDSSEICPQHVEFALDQMPWLIKPASPS